MSLIDELRFGLGFTVQLAWSNTPDFSGLEARIAEQSMSRDLVTARHMAGLTTRQLAKRLHWKVSEVTWTETLNNEWLRGKYNKRYIAYLQACGVVPGELCVGTLTPRFKGGGPTYRATRDPVGS